MKLIVTHDHHGNIVAIGMPAPGTRNLRVLPDDPKHTVSEVDVAGTARDVADAEKMTRKLTDIAERFRVDVAPRRAKLVRHESSSK